MKKLFILCASLIMFVSLVFIGNMSVRAEDEKTQLSLSNEEVVTGNKLYESTNFSLSKGSEEMTAFFTINSGATLTLRNCDLDGLVEESAIFVSNIFKVNDGGKLILDNVRFTNLKYDYAINNSGTIDIKDASFVSNYYSIINSSTKDNSIFLRSGNLGKVKLDSGYISLDKDSKVSGINTLVLKNTVSNGSLVVKGVGENVFAGRYIDNFVYTNASNIKYLDYIGDHDSATPIMANDGVTELQSGDIIVSEIPEILLTDIADTSLTKVSFSTATNCTYNHFMQSYMYMFRKTPTKLNNYTAITSDLLGQYNRVSSAKGKTITATISCENENGQALGTPFVTEFNAGTNHAVFVDIPEGYDYKDTKFYVNSIKNDDILSLNDNKYSNGSYMRPILEYIYSDGINEIYETLDITVKFVFAEVEKQATVNVVAEDNISVEFGEELIVGNAYTFKIPFTDQALITDVYFNGEKVTLIESEEAYFFTAVVDENNTLIVDSIDLPINITVTPNLTKTNFEYEEPIVLTQEYYVEQTGETIIITYTPNDSNECGTYNITTATCNNSNYVISVADGNYMYTISPKVIDLENVITKKIANITYSSNLNLTLDMFVESIPTYLSAELILDDFDPILGEQCLIVEFELQSTNYTFKNDDNNINVTLNISAGTLDTSSCFLEDYTTAYTGEIVALTLSNYDPSVIGVSYKYYKLEDDSKTEVAFAKNCGEYEVIATLSSLHSLYQTDKVLTAKLTITKVNIDLTSYVSSVAEYTFTYDGNSHKADIKLSTLPTEIVRVDNVVNNNGFINVGTYNVTINFDYDEINYTCINFCVSKVIINPKKANIILESSTFPYTGNAPVLKAIVTNLIGQDICDVTLNGGVQSSAGEHTISVVGLSNNNYTFETGLTLKYTIGKINVDLQNVSYENVTCVYDGQRHLPVLTGTLPTGITYNIDNSVPCKDVGEYTVKCTFSSSNGNYNVPEPIYAKVTITKRPVYVEFTEPNNMIANGVAKRISVAFTNVVEGETVGYSENYSDEPVDAGEYTLTIVLASKTNYYIANSSQYTFNVFTNTLSLRAEGVNVKFEGKFTDMEDVSVCKVRNTYVDDVFEEGNIKAYTTFNFNFTSYTTEPIKVSVKAKDVVSNAIYLKVYKVVGESLEEIDYVLDGDLITFNLSSSGEIVFVEGNLNLYTYRFAIYTTYILAILSIIGYISIGIVYSRSKNPYLKLNQKNKQKEDQ